MRPAETRFERLFPAAGEAIGPLRRSLRRFARDAGAPVTTQARVALGFSEACTFLFPGRRRRRQAGRPRRAPSERGGQRDHDAVRSAAGIIPR
jgi:hypothetical protein